MKGIDARPESEAAETEVGPSRARPNQRANEPVKEMR
jgi:hypothetical protein